MFWFVFLTNQYILLLIYIYIIKIFRGPVRSHCPHGPMDAPATASSFFSLILLFSTHCYDKEK
jgi:hypothetical protein